MLCITYSAAQREGGAGGPTKNAKINKKGGLLFGTGK